MTKRCFSNVDRGGFQLNRKSYTCRATEFCLQGQITLASVVPMNSGSFCNAGSLFVCARKLPCHLYWGHCQLSISNHCPRCRLAGPTRYHLLIHEWPTNTAQNAPPQSQTLLWVSFVVKSKIEDLHIHFYFPECFARSAVERQLLLDDDVLLQLARRIPGLRQDSSCGLSDGLYLEPIIEHKSYALTNTAICERNQANEMVSSPYFSMGFSGLSGHYITPSIYDFRDGIAANKMHSMRDKGDDKWFSYQETTGKLSSSHDFRAPYSPMKVSPRFFDEVGLPAIRRSSIDSNSMESFGTDAVCDDEEPLRDGDFEGYTTPGDNGHFQMDNSNRTSNDHGYVAFINHTSGCQNNNRSDLSLTMLRSPEVKCAIDSFTSSMTKSMRSQQAIHDWDRKMGLKRSHSKTMRLSMRSRKRLKIMLKKELGTVQKHEERSGNMSE
jgi:hypothetical protein